jgi:hypothetical protein
MSSVVAEVSLCSEVRPHSARLALLAVILLMLGAAWLGALAIMSGRQTSGERATARMSQLFPGAEVSCLQAAAPKTYRCTASISPTEQRESCDLTVRSSGVAAICQDSSGATGLQRR